MILKQKVVEQTLLLENTAKQSSILLLPNAHLMRGVQILLGTIYHLTLHIVFILLK